MKRASTQLKKDTRRMEILEQARISLQTKSFEDIRLVDLAKELNLVKGTLYLYFPTKQALFASIFMDEAELWWDAFRTAPASPNPGTDIANSLKDRNLLLSLFASLHANIEPGLGREGLLSFKLWMLDFAQRAALDLERRYKKLTGLGLQFMMESYALIVGSAQLAFPPESVARLLQENKELAVFQVNFCSFLETALGALYRGKLYLDLDLGSS